MYYAVTFFVNSEHQLCEFSALPKGTAIKLVSGGGAGVCLCWAEGEGVGEKEGRWSFQFSKVK